jgi:hypothetical protein
MGWLIGGLMSLAVAAVIAGTRWLTKSAVHRRSRLLSVRVRAVHEPSWTMALPRLPEAAWKVQGVRQSEEIASLLTDYGAVDVTHTTARLTITSTSGETVLISGIEARIRRTSPSVTGCAVTYPSAGVGGPIALGFDLDSSNLQALEQHDNQTPGFHPLSPFFVGRNITVAVGEIVDVSVIAQAVDHYYEWDLIAMVETPTKRRAPFQLNPANMPFRTSGQPTDGYEQPLCWAWHRGGKFMPLEAMNRMED